MFEIGSLLKLTDQNEYVVVSSAQKDGKTYYYLIDQNNFSNVQFLVEEKIENETYLKEVEDSKILEQIYPLLLENGKKFLKK